VIPSIIGIAASAGTAISLLPQLIKLCRDKKADDLSLPMLAILFVGLSLWIWYGILKNDLIIIISNAISLSLNISIVILSLKYRKTNPD
jgi:MtN3 and saliva related transmembrane protein